MKTKEERIALKEEAADLNAKLAELSDEKLSQVAGGVFTDIGNYTIDSEPHKRRDLHASANE